MAEVSALAPLADGRRVMLQDAVPTRHETVLVHRTIGAAAPAWDRLEASAPASAYQRRAWVSAWQETTGRGLGVEPFIVVAHDGAGHPVALLPLGLRRLGPLKVIEFLGGRDSNFNLGLFHPDHAWSGAAAERLLRRACAASGVRVDLVMLRNQPPLWEGRPNPLALIPAAACRPSPSSAHSVRLRRDPEAFFRDVLSKDSRKKLRRKAEKLAEHGPVEYSVARAAPAAEALIDTFLKQRTARCAALGLGTRDLPGLAAFLKASSCAGSADPAIELHGLACGGETLATFAGAAHRGRLSGMVISFDADSPLARFSPGDLLLAEILKRKCEEGLSSFDLGVGEARYKSIFCPTTESLVDTTIAISLRGRAARIVETSRLRAKRAVKRSTWAWRLVVSARRALARMRLQRYA